MIESTHRYQRNEGATVIDNHRAKDAGMALTLIALLLAYFWDSQRFLVLAIVLMIVNMSVPGVFKAFAKVWFGLSHILGAVMSRLLLSLIFFLLVTPVGLARRLMGKDSLKLRSWKNGSESVFVIRDVTFSKDNIEKPY
jgi:hypothetical protein